MSTNQDIPIYVYLPTYTNLSTYQHIPIYVNLPSTTYLPLPIPKYQYLEPVSVFLYVKSHKNDDTFIYWIIIDSQDPPATV